MRKLFWCCAVMIVAAAATTYAGADYVCNHPFSLLGRSAVLAYRVGMSTGDIARAASAVIRKSCQDADQKPATPRPEHSLSCVPPDPQPVVEPKAAPAPAVPQNEVWDPNLQGRLPGHIVINEEQEPPAPVVDIQPPPPLPLETGAKGVIDEDHRTMPYCADDNPPPCADEPPTKNQGCSWTDFWMMFFPKPAETTKTGGAEESEMNGAGHMPKCQEDPAIDTQYPGCPHHDCHERMVCPYTGKSYPVDEAVEPPQKPKQKKKKQKPADPDRISKKIESSPWWWGPLHPDLDTMEFRKSDWKPDDVQLPPF
jgi:hypothetical protein